MQKLKTFHKDTFNLFCETIYTYTYIQQHAMWSIVAEGKHIMVFDSKGTSLGLRVFCLPYTYL